MIVVGVLLLALILIGVVLAAATGVLWGYWWLLEPKPRPRGFEVLLAEGSEAERE